MKFGALILAAGYSSRMGEFKPLLKIDGTPLIEHAVALFRKSGIEEIVTVVGYRAETLIPVLEATSSRHVVNENYQNGMFSSIRKGVAALKDTCDAFFLLPVDIPWIRISTVKLLLEKYAENPSVPVFYPEFDSRRGHPPLIDCRLIDHILSYSGNGGMRGLLGKYQDQAENVPVADPFIRLDVDTKEDLLHLEREIRMTTTD